MSAVTEKYYLGQSLLCSACNLRFNKEKMKERGGGENRRSNQVNFRVPKAFPRGRAGSVP